MSTLPFYVMGSKYSFYRSASVSPSYLKITEEDFRNKMCHSNDARVVNGEGLNIVYGLGQVLAEFDTQVRTDYRTSRRHWDHTLRRPLPTWDKLRQTVTLTDGKSWAFMVGCWLGSDQKMWTVASATMELSAATLNQIISHALTLGFKKENFVQLNYDRCWLENSILTELLIKSRKQPEQHNSRVGGIKPITQVTSLRPTPPSLRVSEGQRRPVTSTSATTTTKQAAVRKLQVDRKGRWRSADGPIGLAAG